MDQKIKNRILRLQAMANDSSSEHEAMIAARRLHALLAKHGMTIEEVEFAPEVSVNEDFYTVCRKTGGGNWSKAIGAAIAKLYFCQAMVSPAGGTAHHVVIIGQERYRTTAVAMAKAITSVVNAQARLSSKTERPAGVDGWAYITSFRNAAAERIYERCEQMIAAASAGTLKDEDGDTLPVLASEYKTLGDEARDWMNQKYKTHRPKAKTRTTSAAGARRGDSFGSSVSLGNEVGTDTKLIK